MPHKGEIIRSLIERTPFTLDEVAKRMHVTRMTVYNHLKKEDIDDRTLDRFADALRIDIRKSYPNLYHNPNGTPHIFTPPAVVTETNIPALTQTANDIKDEHIATLHRLIAAQEEIRRLEGIVAELKRGQ